LESFRFELPGEIAMRKVRIGAGAGYSGDRIDPAIELAQSGQVSYLVFECLAERTIALAQLSKRIDQSAGYDPLLAERMEAVLPICHRNHIRIISNMGAANPVSAAMRTREIARNLGIGGLRIAAVTGDDVVNLVRELKPVILDDDTTVESLGDKILSANAYLGVEPLLEAIATGADVILTGRIADPSLFLAPLIHEFNWPLDDWPLMGRGTVIGHLLECAGQLTGGYFADPGYKDVPNLARLGFPIAEVSEDGSAIVTKVTGSGGLITAATCKEQLLYEIMDPAAYFTPDVVADFTGVEIREQSLDRVKISGGSGSQRPSNLKVSIGYQDGFVGEGQISYAGPGALARARLSREILAERLSEHHFQDLRFDFIGVSSIHGETLSQTRGDPYEVRLRAAARASSRQLASLIPREVEALYTNGPAGGGGVSGSVRETVAISSALLPRELIPHHIHLEVS
jgi:hypothetical protein